MDKLDEKLQRLKDLYDRNLIDEKQYKEQQQILLASWTQSSPATQAANSSHTIGVMDTELDGEDTPPATAQEIFSPGQIVGDKYEIIELLGKGGMGVVYKVRHLLLQENMALKVLHAHMSQNPKVKQRFVREMKIARKLVHKNILQVADFGETQNGRQFFTMDFSNGISLQQLQQQTKLSEERAVGITKQILEGLVEAHNLGVIHRDLKPANILVENRSQCDHVLILDFGIAKLNQEQDVHLTQEGAIGTPHYMSPEQAAEEELDARSDLFSVGIILYQMLCGQLPFTGNTKMQILMARINRQAIPIQQFSCQISKHIENVVNQALQREKQKRFANAEEFLQALEQQTTALRKTTPKNQELLQHLARIQQPSPPFYIEVWSELWRERQEQRKIVVSPCYPMGERINICFSSDKDCYLTLINIDPDGDITVLFPNKFQQDNHIVAHEVHKVGEKGFQFIVGEPHGNEVVKAIATTKKMNLLDMDLQEWKSALATIPKERAQRKIMVLAETLAEENLQWSEASHEFAKDE
ncbi:serine/threonine-protein kinase [Candidatus Uabimicrobium amorphum]|uniref:non-specific serine/threonine protein kinase n=1 Tax=Uabimicrobium amorphum TaxID=2596890 RepID=A0A5S9IR72_UABAM|nr:serine/threonine-protein kinase [Candidatus Uabimicrobium amorphum]BBM86599.1 protein kinase [Candidatus Uabimicrobium amorphum]